jgi:hypothetical protein
MQLIGGSVHFREQSLDFGTAAVGGGHQQGKVGRELATLGPICGSEEGPYLGQRVVQEVGVGMSGPEKPGDGIAPGITVVIC